MISIYKAVYEERGVVPLYFDIMTVVAAAKMDMTWNTIFKWPNGYEVGEPLFYDL